MRVKMRQAQREMKGVKLQYTDDDRVTFDDVAGIGDAKVGFRVFICLCRGYWVAALNKLAVWMIASSLMTWPALGTPRWGSWA